MTDLQVDFITNVLERAKHDLVTEYEIDRLDKDLIRVIMLIRKEQERRFTILQNL